jgi:hypothetical protein
MKWVDTSTHSFIVKIWLEETVEQSGNAKWRGCVTHVSSGERRYVESLQAISEFIGRYLETMGVNLGFRQHIRHLLLRWREPRENHNER